MKRCKFLLKTLITIQLTQNYLIPLRQHTTETRLAYQEAMFSAMAAHSTTVFNEDNLKNEDELKNEDDL